jgi:undecaprenyl-diphosphatase
MFEVIFLSIVQGVTEFLPISSSAHLILVSKYFNFNNESLTLDISLHLGSLLAIIFYFKEDFKNFINNKVLFFKIILSSIPLMFFGFLLIKFNLIDFLRSYKIIGWSTVFFGILLYLSDLIKVKKTIKKDFNFSSVLYIGFFQVLALIPGVSRSGITITGARFFNFSRFDSARISFLTAIPVLTAVSIYGFRKVLLEGNLEVSIINLFGIFLSFIFSYITIKFFFKFIKKFTLFYFMVYRVILGLIILFYAY